MRFFVYISYKGTNYHGWQMQINAISLQQVITDSLHTLLKDKNIAITASGRTDAGVHAREQVFHVDLSETVEIDDLLNRLNGILPNDIVINKILPVPFDAHARFDASKRSYEYHLRFKKTPFGEHEYYYHRNPLDVEAMNKGASYLLGQHDFESFSKVKTEVNNFVCTITKAEWVKKNDQLIFHISANRFLRSMVRTIVGTLLDIGEGKMKVGEVIKIMEKKDRSAAGRSVPAKGLYLCKVEYPNFK